MTIIQDDLLHMARVRALLQIGREVYDGAAAAERAMQDLKRLYDAYSEPTADAPDSDKENEDA